MQNHIINTKFYQMINGSITSIKYTFKVLVHMSKKDKEEVRTIEVYIRPQKGENLDTAISEIPNQLGRSEKAIWYEKIKEENLSN